MSDSFRVCLRDDGRADVHVGPGRPSLGDTQRLHVKVPGELLERLDEAAGELGKTRSEAVREAVELWLEVAGRLGYT